MNILLIDNTMDVDCWGSKDIARFLSSGSTVVHVRRAPHDDLPKDVSRFDSLVLSGSRTSCLKEEPWIENLDLFVRNYLALRRPFLGLCYGHQVLCRVLGGRGGLRRGSTPEFGWTRIELTEESPLFAGLPSSFYSFSSHYEEAFVLPPDTKLLARSERCSIQAIQLAKRPVYGLQFHPEKLEEEGNISLEKDIKEGKKDGILGFRKSKELYNAKVGEILFQNFLEMK